MSRLLRLSTIARTVLRYRLDTFIDTEKISAPLSTLLIFAPWQLLPAPQQSRGERLRKALEELGPVFIKFGQMLSTRGDLLPADIITELAKLQDQVPPFEHRQARAIIEQALGKPVAELFADFDETPMASASVAQVHAATLQSGEQVVVKVVRPGIEKVIRQDIKLMFTLARAIEKYLPDGPRLRAVEVVDDYQHTILDELNLQQEGANTSQLRRYWQHSDLLYIPEVYWDYTRHTVLTMERIDGIAVTDVQALKQQNTNMKRLAERGVEIFFTQVLRDSFFHADMHPGNIFVSKQHPDSPQYIAIDCAIIGSLSEADQYYLARNLLAIFQRDYRLVAELHVESGWVGAETKVHEFEAAIRCVCEPIFDKPLREISFGLLLISVFQTARRFDMQVQPSLVLLQKTLLHIEGLGRELYPDLNLWNTAKPFLEQWLKDRYSPCGVYKRISKKLPGWLEQLPELPDTLLSKLQQPSPHNTENNPASTAAQQWQQHARTQKKHKFTALACLILLLMAALTANPQLLDKALALPAISYLLAGAATVLWLIR